MKNIKSPTVSHCQSLPPQQVEKPLFTVGTFNPATQDAQQLYDICEMNAHLRTVSWYAQWKELKQTYKELTQGQHSAILRDYIRNQNK